MCIYIKVSSFKLETNSNIFIFNINSPCFSLKRKYLYNFGNTKIHFQLKIVDKLTLLNFIKCQWVNNTEYYPVCLNFLHKFRSEVI